MNRLTKVLADIRRAAKPWPVVVWLGFLLVRPLIDTTWQLKHSALGFSPLQIVGVLLPLFFILAIWLRRHEIHGLLRNEWAFIAWGVLLLAASVTAVIVQPDAEATGAALKFILPPLAVLFGYLYLREDRVLHAAAVVLALAGVVPALFLVYELIAGSMGTSLRSGVERYTGPYAQVSVYGIHFSLMLLGAGMLALYYGGRRLRCTLITLVALLAFAAAWLVHLSTWAVWLGLMLLILTVLLRKKNWHLALSLAVVTILFAIAGFLSRGGFGQFTQTYIPDAEIITGVRPVTQAMNSRGYIWEGYLQDFQSLPWYAQLFGSSLSGRSDFGAMGFAAHNDFLRVLVLTGIVGLLLYLLWLIRIGVKVGKGRGERRLFGAGAMIILLGYSVALTPTYIMPLVTAVLPVLGGMMAARETDHV